MKTVVLHCGAETQFRLNPALVSFHCKLPKDFKFKSPFVVASAVSPELLREPVKALRSVGVEIQIINQKLE